MENKKVVKVIGFISSGEFHNDKVKNPLPKNYLSRSGLPRVLIDETKENGWCDEKGNVCFPTTFQPDPVRGEDGNVYLCMNDTYMDTPIGVHMLMKGMNLLIPPDTREWCSNKPTDQSLLFRKEKGGIDSFFN